MKKYYLFLACIFFSKITYSQIKFELSLPLIQYQATNVDELKDGFSNDYYNHFYLPNFQFNAKYKNLTLGVRHYYNHESNYEGRYFPGKLVNLDIKSYSLFTGINVLENTGIEVNAGIGYTRFSSPLGVYDDFMSGGEGFVCYGKNPNTLLFWSDLKYNLNSKYFISLNTALNPMFKNLEGSNCWSDHTHDRYHIFVAQLMVGCRF
jgi:hypothetical protein